MMPRWRISDLPRKSIEPIALAAGVAPRTLQEFMGLHRWDEGAVRRRVQRVVMRDHADPNAIALVDETSVSKRETRPPASSVSPAVRRARRTTAW